MAEAGHFGGANAPPRSPLSREKLLAGFAIESVPRALALMDRRDLSPIRGCLDRQYWYYRTISEFPGATWQQPMMAFAAIYAANSAHNPYFRDQRMMVAARNALLAWCRCQHRDGSFDEWYRNERSYCATAFTSAAAGLTLWLLRDSLDRASAERGLKTLVRAGAWLSGRYNAAVMNQNLAAGVAFQALAALTEERHWQEISDAHFARVAAGQTSEGWLLEYGGPDFGYSTLALDLLGLAAMLGARGSSEEITEKLLEFLFRAIGHSNCPAGQIGSRGTTHVFPYGALRLAPRDSRAATLLSRWLTGFEIQLLLTPARVDDRYFCYFYFPLFAIAFEEACRRRVPQAELEPPRDCEFRDSGLSVRRKRGWGITINRRLGCAVALETTVNAPLLHLGYEVLTAAGKLYGSANLAAELTDCAERDAVCGHAEFRAISAGVPLRRWLLPFQLVTYLLVHSSLAQPFQNSIKRRMISPAARLPLRMSRKVMIEEKAVNIIDRFEPAKGLPRLDGLRVASEISMHSPSARQGGARCLTVSEELLSKVTEELNTGQSAELRIDVRFEENSPAGFVWSATLSDR